MCFTESLTLIKPINFFPEFANLKNYYFYIFIVAEEEIAEVFKSCSTASGICLKA